MFKTVMLLAIFNAYRKEIEEENEHPSTICNQGASGFTRDAGKMIRMLSSIVSKQTAGLLYITARFVILRFVIGAIRLSGTQEPSNLQT
jgi:hypothetical protein